jgi:hypothetical protein
MGYGVRKIVTSLSLARSVISFNADVRISNVYPTP